MALPQILPFHTHTLQNLSPSLPVLSRSTPIPIQRRQQSSITLLIHIHPQLIQHLTRVNTLQLHFRLRSRHTRNILTA